MSNEKPTIATIEKLMDDEGDHSVEIRPDGTIQRAERPTQKAVPITKGLALPSSY